MRSELQQLSGVHFSLPRAEGVLLVLRDHCEHGSAGDDSGYQEWMCCKLLLLLLQVGGTHLGVQHWGCCSCWT